MAQVMEGDNHLLRDIVHPPPGDVTRENRKSKYGRDTARTKSVYFEDAFQSHREVNPAKERVHSESIVMAEVRTNVIVRTALSL